MNTLSRVDESEHFQKSIVKQTAGFSSRTDHDQFDHSLSVHKLYLIKFWFEEMLNDN